MKQELRSQLMRRCATLVLVWSMHAVGLLITPQAAQTVQAQGAGLPQDASGAGSAGVPLPGLPDQADVPQIFGGREAQPGAWPWQAALVWADAVDAYRGQYCGGTLIAPQWVLTAAHCVEGMAPHEVAVVLGRHRLASQEGERIAVAAFLIHPDFNYLPFRIVPDLDADIALIRLATPSAQPPVVLFRGPAGQEERHYLAGTVTGWGLLESFTFPDGLHEVLVPLAAPDVCAQSYGSLLTENMICAGYPKGFKGPCYGDSGGPLLVRSRQAATWQQIGIVSWGAGCAEAGGYGVYTRVAGYTAWLDGCLADAASLACSGLDAYEPDDRAQQATPVAIGDRPQMHNFHLRSDRDWLTFTAQAGRRYQIDVQALGEASDPLVWVYDRDGVTPLAYDDDSGGDSSARLVWRAPESATYYVELQDLAGTRGSATAYSVTIQAVTLSVYLPVLAH